MDTKAQTVKRARMSVARINAGRYTVKLDGKVFALVRATSGSWNSPSFWQLRQCLPDGSVGQLVGLETRKASVLLCLKDGIYSEKIIRHEP